VEFKIGQQRGNIKKKINKDKFIHDGFIGPKDGVAVEFLCGIKRHEIALLTATACTPIAIDVCLYSPLLPSDVAQELEVQFIMSFLKYVSIGSLYDLLICKRL
jgi:hypothetical protein